MASLFEHLLETMPFAGAAGAIDANHIPLKEATTESLKRFLRYLAPDEGYVAKVPDVDKTLQPIQQGLWGWTYDPADPASVSDLWCRVRNADYVGQKVLERLSFGLEDPIGNFRNVIRVTTTCGFAVELPLTPEFLVDRWVALSGFLAPDANQLWPLEALHDRSLVLAFVFDLDANGDPHSMPKDAAREAAMKEMQGPLKPHTPPAGKKESPKNPFKVQPATPEDAPLFSDIMPKADNWGSGADLIDPEEAYDEDLGGSGEEPWFARGTKDDFMPLDAEQATVAGEVGSICPATTGAARILVVLTLTVARERSKYDAAGVTGVGNLYPHILVKANVPLTKIESSIQFDRPEKTTRMESEETKGCCRTHDVSDDTINSLLVTDSNTNNSLTSYVGAPTFPFWCNLFNYYVVNAYQTLANERLHMVRRDRPQARIDDSGWIVRKTVTGLDSKEVRKVARQGEFDNIHMAPKLKLINIHHMQMRPSGATRNPGDDMTYPFAIDRETMRLDDITMAPFCAHDCFHIHWRWSKMSDDQWAMGWDNTGPYRVPGAPMVPLNQNVDVWFRAQNQVTYHAIVSPDDDAGFIRSHTLQVIMHHGSGYALFFTAYFIKLQVELAFDVLAPPPLFYGTNDLTIGSDSTAMFFWWCRFSASLSDLTAAGDTPVYVISERTLFADLEKARDL